MYLHLVEILFRGNIYAIGTVSTNRKQMPKLDLIKNMKRVICVMVSVAVGGKIYLTEKILRK